MLDLTSAGRPLDKRGLHRQLVGRLALVLVAALAGIMLGAVPAGSQNGDGCPQGFEQSNDPVIWGTPKSDRLCGGDGPNVIIGGLLDDEIYGGGGNDIIIGGHGTDSLFGQSGDDLLRGGDNSDVNAGGPGDDTASFADVTPLGDDHRGVFVNVPANKAEIGDWTFDGETEGFTDPLNDIENVIGSAFDDTIVAPGTGVVTLWGGAGEDELRGTNGDALEGEQGEDRCFNNDVSLTCSGPQARRSGAAVYGELRKRDRGIVVFGTNGNDTISIGRNGDQVQVSASGAPATEGHCQGGGPVNCTLSGADAARYVVVWSDDGADTVSFDGNFQLGPYELRGGINGGTVDVYGGNGGDTLNGGPEDELLFSGESGNDNLNGGGGADALLSEGSGGDVVHAGAGDDQIVADNACAGHDLYGEGDFDVIGFARQRHVAGALAGVNAQMGEGSTSGLARAIRANDAVAEPCTASILRGQSEVLEGTEQHDRLVGNDSANTIWARTGDDFVDGRGGDDHVFGHTNKDKVLGGLGRDWLYGGDGDDELLAKDEVPDHEINCGGGGDPIEPIYDRGLDPEPVGCEPPIHTDTFLTLDGWLNGQPGYASVHGNVKRGNGNPAIGYVNVNFQELVNGAWDTKITVHRTLSNGYYEVNNQPGVGVGQWRVRAVFPDGQDHYVASESGYHDFEVKHGYRIIARHSGKCLDVSGRRTENGQSIHQWDCQDPNTHQNQVFSLVPQSTGGLQLVARHSGRCVDVANVSQTAGAYLQQYDCLGAGQSNQLWWRDQIAPGSDYFTFKAKHSGQCMDVQGGGMANGARLTQWPCIGGQLNQHWDLEPINSGPILTQTYLTAQELHGQPGYVNINGNVKRSPHNDGSGIPMSGVVNVRFEKFENGAWRDKDTIQRTLSNGSYSIDNYVVGVGQWRIWAVFPEGQSNFARSESSVHGFTIRPGYHIVNRYSDKCMSLSGNNGSNGTAIIQWACSSSPSPGDGQVMHRVPMPGGGWQLKINSTGKCVDVSGVSQSNGAWLQQWDCLGAGQANQIWQVIPISGQLPWLAFRAFHSQKCADVTGPSPNNGVRIQQWDCHWGGGQQWDMRPVG